jgi:hypothetical protein
MRSRVCSNTTIAPCSRASLIMGRLDNKRVTCFSGRRSDLLLKRITEGLFFPHNANIVPKSVSEEISIQFSDSASEKIFSSSAACNP